MLNRNEEINLIDGEIVQKDPSDFSIEMQTHTSTMKIMCDQFLFASTVYYRINIKYLLTWCLVFVFRLWQVHNEKHFSKIIKQTVTVEFVLEVSNREDSR